MGGFIGLATLGRTPRRDFEAAFKPHLGGVPFDMRGALDGISDDECISLHDAHGDYPIHIPVARDEGIDAPRENIRPYLQRLIDRLVEDGASIVAILCAGDLGDFSCSVPLISAGRVVPHMVQATLGTDLPIGVVTPNSGQVPFAKHKWSDDGFRASVVDVPPYTTKELRVKRLMETCQQMKDAGAKAIVLDCFGFSAQDGQLVYRELGLPVFVAREIAARATGMLALCLEPGKATK